MKIVGLGHYSRTGKDTFANALVDWIPRHSNLKVAKIPFADKLKDICQQLYGWDGLKDREYYDTPEGEKLRDVPLPTIGKTPVEIWVAMGTPAVRQNVYERTWIDYLLRTDLGLDILIIPDVRFPNEVEAIREHGGTIHKIVRPGYGPRNTVADKALLGFTGWDYIWGAHGNIDQLRVEAYRIGAALVGLDGFPIQTIDDKARALSVEKLPDLRTAA